MFLFPSRRGANAPFGRAYACYRNDNIRTYSIALTIWKKFDLGIPSMDAAADFLPLFSARACLTNPFLKSKTASFKGLTVEPSPPPHGKLPWQIFGRYVSGTRYDHQPFDDIFEFPDISGPGVFLKGPDHIVVNACFANFEIGVFFHKKIDQAGDIVFSFTQRRHGDGKNIESKK